MTAPGARRLYLGWQYATPYPPPGPPPRRPTPPERERVVPGWVDAQRREENMLNRPLKAVCGVCVTLLAASVAGGLAGWLNGLVAGLVAVCATLVAVVSGNAIWQGERALSARVEAERRRVESIQANSESRLFASQAEHAARMRDWQARRVAYQHQKRWYAVATPDGIGRVDIAGGTLPGWSAMLTTAAAHRLAARDEVTVLDLTGSPVALDLIAFARSARVGVSPQVWVLPEDLPSLELGRGLDGAALADVLSLAVSAIQEQVPNRDLSLDNAILERVLDVLADADADGNGGLPPVAAVTAALRTLGQIGDPADDIAAGLISQGQADRLRVMFGDGASDRLVVERAWAMESQLRKLAALGTGLPPPSRCDLRVLAVSGQAGVVEGKVLGAYLVVALTHALRQAEPGGPWRHTLFVLGAERLRGDLLDRLSDACESTGTGLVLAYRTIAAQVKARLGRGNAAVAFMRLGNAEDAKAASEQIGTEHRFVLSQLTETVGRSVTDTTAGSYTSTVARTGSLNVSRSASESSSRTAGHGRSEQGGVLPLGAASYSRNAQDSESWTTGEAESLGVGLSASTAWGRTTSAAAGSSESLGRTTQRSREFLLEPHDLQQLPPSAMIVSYAGPAGRELVLADANPGIAALDTATMRTLEESAALPPIPDDVNPPPAPDPRPQPPNLGPQPPNLGPAAPGAPNLGPPPPRLDWRRP